MEERSEVEKIGRRRRLGGRAKGQHPNHYPFEVRLRAVSDRASGRPAPRIDREKEALREKSARLEKTVEGLKRALKIREILKASNLERGAGRAEKKE